MAERRPLPTSTDSDADCSAELIDRVRAATAHGRPLRIAGGDTKRFYGRQVEGERLDVAPHRGVLSYDPSELVITARAGTPILEIEALLAGHRQKLAFEPPVFGEASTLGGVVASGLAGQARPFAGGVRDSVLGVRVLDGRGAALRLGGTVFKNVAGFDGFRPMAGALGCLGVLLDVSLRVAPMAEAETTAAIIEDWGAARLRLRALMSRQSGLTGAVHDGERLHLRFARPENLPPDSEPTSPDAWRVWRAFSTPLLSSPRLWRLSLPPTADLPHLPGERLIDWAGGQAWLTTSASHVEVTRACAERGGHATLFRGAREDEAVFSLLAPALLALHRRLKLAFDPAGVFNPGRMYEGL